MPLGHALLLVVCALVIIYLLGVIVSISWSLL